MTDKDLFKIDCDEDTAKFLEIVLWNLQRYFFCQSKEKGADLIQKLYTDFSYYFEQDFHFQDGAFHVAAKIQYEYMLDGAKPDFEQWLRENGIFNQPREALEYFRRNYFD